MTVYITGAGAHLPGDPVDNDEAARRLGDPAPGLRKRVLAANGIRTRHYALDADGGVTATNADLAAAAVAAALDDRGVTLDDVTMLATGTTQGDDLVPGFASSVHGRLGGGPLELLSAGGVCASGMAAFAAAVRAVAAGDHERAVVVGSEQVSRTLRAASPLRPAEFLRWTLSDGAGAVVVESAPRADGPSLRVDWVHHVSLAHENAVCMGAGAGWLDGPTVDPARLRLHQDVGRLPDLFRAGVREFGRLVALGRVHPKNIDHLLCHYSAEHFRGDVAGLLHDADLTVPAERWYTNLHTRGNTGAASIFVMLTDAWHEGRFAPGDRILLVVPESGRFSFAFAHLTCVAGDEPPAPAASPDASLWTVTELARVWEDFTAALSRVPIVRRIEDGTAMLDDYKRLLVHLRQQVVEGSRWISRAASNLTDFHFRSAAIKHAADEHGDFQLLERDFVAVGGTLAEIRGAPKNAGAEALSAYVFQQASRPDPVDLLGAMFVIEGLGNRLALGWARRLQQQLSLRDDQVSFLVYHGAADEEHVAELDELLGRIDLDQARRVVRTAEVVARLYALQLEEVDR
jgi:3-oxoacyl-[acyl-carrier-protein] synthase III